MKRLALVFLILFANRAFADTECSASNEVPLGCPFIVYVGPDSTVQVDLTITPVGGLAKDLNGSVVESMKDLDFLHDDVDASCIGTEFDDHATFRIFTIADFTANPGDVITFDGISATIAAARPCETSPPSLVCTTRDPACTGTPQYVEEGWGNECNAGGPSGFGLVSIALLFLLRRRQAAVV